MEYGKYSDGPAQLGSVVYPLLIGMILDATKNNYFIVLMTIAATYALCATIIQFLDEKRRVDSKASVAAE